MNMQNKKSIKGARRQISGLSNQNTFSGPTSQIVQLDRSDGLLTNKSDRPIRSLGQTQEEEVRSFNQIALAGPTSHTDQSELFCGPTFRINQSELFYGPTFRIDQSELFYGPNFRIVKSVCLDGPSFCIGQSDPSYGPSFCIGRQDRSDGPSFCMDQSDPYYGPSFHIVQSQFSDGSSFLIDQSDARTDHLSVSSNQILPMDHLSLSANHIARSVTGRNHQEIKSLVIRTISDRTKETVGT